MIKFSRILTVAVTVLAVAFMSVAAVAVAVRTDWRARTKQFSSAEISEQQQKISELDRQIKATEDELQASAAAIASDVTALTNPAGGAEARLEAQIKELVEQSRKLAGEIEVAASNSQSRLDELSLRREDAFRLEMQYDELVAQKQAAQAEVKRLQDLLIQAKGVRERVERRQKSLQEQGSAY